MSARWWRFGYNKVTLCWLTLEWEKTNEIKFNARFEWKTANRLLSMGWWIGVVSGTDYVRDSTSGMWDQEFAWSHIPDVESLAKLVSITTTNWGGMSEGGSASHCKRRPAIRSTAYKLLLGVLRFLYKGYEQLINFSGNNGFVCELGVLGVLKLLYRGYGQLVIFSGTRDFNRF